MRDGRRTTRSTGPELALLAPAGERERYAHKILAGDSLS